MPNVRPELLRRFYEASWQGGVAPEQLYEGATFDEYYALERVRYPQISRNTAAKNAPFDAFRALVRINPPEPPNVVPVPRNVHLSRRDALDLRNEAIDPGTERLVLDRIKCISGWDALARFTRLRTLMVVLSGTDAPVGRLCRAEVDRIEIIDCTISCLRSVLRSTSARSVSFSEPGGMADLSLLEGHTNLRELTAGASLIRGIERLPHWPLTIFDAGLVEVDDAFRTGVAAQAGSLCRLAVSSRSPFSPTALPKLDTFWNLRRVEVSIHEMEYCEEWIAYALSRPEIDFVFMRIVNDTNAQSVSLEEIYRGFDILRIGRGKTAVFEVSGDIAAEVGGTNNSDVEDLLMGVAAEAHKQLSWLSESGTFVAQAKDVTTCRWLIDEIHHLADRSR
jgi:hypothetical protein